MTKRPLLHAVLTAAAISAAAIPSTAQAQGAPDVVRGRVVDDSSRAVAGAVIMITRGPDRLTLGDTTDASGNYRVRFEQGTGDYLVYVSATGFKSARRRVQRQTTETELVADFTLGKEIAELDAVRVSARRPVRATNPISATQPETGASEKWQDGIVGAISPTVAGDLNATAGLMSNVTMTPGGASILGSGSESNLNTLNGMGMAAGSIPRAARTETRVTGATFDPTRGGFAGANIDVRLGPGDRNFQRRNAFVTLDPQSWQFSDPVGRALGAPSGGFRASFGADGELIRRMLTYNVAVDVARSSSDPATLLTATADALRLSGVSPDSVARLIAISSPLGLPVTATGIPSSRARNGVTWLGRIDVTRDTMKTRALTSYLGYTTETALGFGPLAAPSSAGERKERTLGAQLTLGEYVGPGRRILTETRLAASAVRTKAEPYQQQPAANVLVRSAVDEERDITSLSLGGGSFFATNDSRWTVEGSNETLWNARGRTHRFKGLLWGRADGIDQDGVSNNFGTFTFNSIDDLQANRPSSFSRTLGQSSRSGSVWNAAAALAHNYSHSRFFSVLYGFRLESDGFLESPARNPALEQALGVTTGAAPSRLHISPRLGFSWTYNKSRDNGNGTNQTPVGRFYRTTSGVVRGGIGEFRDLLRPGILADASGATGLGNGTSTLSCVGLAVPTVDWDTFSENPESIPTQCADGSAALGERAPAVTLIDPGYDVPRSWRASLDWSTNLLGSLLIRLGGLASYDLSQPGVVDANFAGVSRFNLSGENGRPVYVSPSGIDPVSGSVSAAQSRISDQFGRVATRVSDLEGYGGQLTFGISPDVFRYRPKVNFYTSASYTLQWTRRQFRGFDGAGFGDPRETEWAPAGTDARHVLVFTGGVNARKLGTITLFARAQSGLPFTPIVQGDVNGDGRTGDRAFVPDPAVTADPAVASGIRSLLESGEEGARECIAKYLGSAAGRNGCRGPWTQSLNVQWRIPTPTRWGSRIRPTLYLQNVLAGVDQAIHGSESLKGWGSQSAPDPVLLVPRGFEAGSNSFRYDVNSRFGQTRGGRSIGRDPFRVVLDFSVNLSTDFDVQRLQRAVEPVRTSSGWERRSADSLASFYLAQTSSIHKLMISESDSLFLSRDQVAALKVADSVFSARVRGIFVPLGQYLSAGKGVAGKAELDSVKATQKEYWRIFWEQPEVAGAIVNPTQRQLLPMFDRMIETPMEDRKNSQWQFGHPVKFSDKPQAPPPAAAPNQGEQIRRVPSA
jgi:hypothetical protein